MPLLEIDCDPSPHVVRQFGLFALPAFFIILGIVIWRRTGSAPAAAGFGMAAAVSVVATLLLPKTIRWMFLAGTVAAFPIAWTVSHLLLAVVYFGPFTAIGLAARAFGYDPMRRRLERATRTYWVRRDSTPKQTESYFQQF
jgi:hypothetical protein